MAQLVPISNAPNQMLRVSLAINGGIVTLNLRFYYNAAGGFWVMDVQDQLGNELVSSVPLVTGVWPAANILAPYEYLLIGAAFVINLAGGSGDIPDASNLGASFALLWDSN